MFRGECLEPMVPWEEALTVDIAADASHLYFVDRETMLERMDLSSGEVEELARGEHLVALSLGGGALHFLDLGAAGEPTLRVPTAGGEVVEVFREAQPRFAFDGRTYFFSERGMGEIRTMPADGGLSERWMHANGVAWIAIRDEHVYWSEMIGASERTISRATPDLSFAETLWTGEVGVVAFGDEFLFGYSATSGVVYRLPLDGGDRQVLAMVEPSEVGAGELAVTSGYVYFQRPVAHSLHRVPVDGGPVETVLGEGRFLWSMAAHEDVLYFPLANVGVFRLPDDFGTDG